MKSKSCLLVILSFIQLIAIAGVIKGKITDKNGVPLPFASITIKGTTSGTTANNKADYSLTLSNGNYTLICQHVGHKAIEKKIKVSSREEVLNFEMEEQEYDLKAVVVKSGGEDPAYEIIRNAIKKRPDYLDELKKFECNVYIKGQMQLRSYPKKFFGQKVDFEDGDTSQRKIIFLSETVAKYSRNGKEDRKVEVISTRVSGQSDGYGFSSPQIISFYENNIGLGRGLNPRGFVSPIAQSALNFYKYKFEGTFYENGKEISKIKVIPKRKYEPLFSGYINIIENEWRIHSLKLTALKEQQMQFLDTLVVEQLYVPLGNNWVIKNQVIYPAGKFFTFDFFGSFVQVYSDFNLSPNFNKSSFNNTILKFTDSSNKRPKSYWDEIRPIPLADNEVKDYIRKDSLEQVQKSPKYQDSLDRRANRITFGNIIFSGQSFSKRKKRESISIPSFLSSINNNTVEGWVYNFNPSFFKRFNENGREALTISPTIRYGFGNKHWNGNLEVNYSFGKKYFNNISIAGGSKVFQFNNANPILPRTNSFSTLYWTNNLMKIYEAGFFRAGYTGGLGRGLTFNSAINFQDRRPLENMTDPNYWRKMADRSFTANYPTDLLGATQIKSHQAFIMNAGITWQPGAKYIEFPDRKINVGSRYPTLQFSLTQGLNGVLGSDVNYTKWRFSVSDNLNMKLGGRFSYRVNMGGFLNADKVYIPDYIHFLGGQTSYASVYLNSFQLAPFYRYSNTEKFYTTAHVEYHLNGLLTNKIPVIRKLNWFLLTGANAFHVNKNNYYLEAFFGVENIFKFIRIDFIQGYMPNGATTSGLRFSTSGLFTGGDD